MQLGGIGVVARLRSCRKVSGGGGRHPGGWKNYPGMRRGRKGPAGFAWFFRVRPHPRCHNLNHQPSKQGTLRLSGYIQGGTSHPFRYIPRPSADYRVVDFGYLNHSLHKNSDTDSKSRQRTEILSAFTITSVILQMSIFRRSERTPFRRKTLKS